MGRKTINAPCINSHSVVCSGRRFRFCCGICNRSCPSFISVSLKACCLSAFSPAEYAENIGDGKNQEFRETEQKRILDLLENF